MKAPKSASITLNSLAGTGWLRVERRSGPRRFHGEVLLEPVDAEGVGEIATYEGPIVDFNGAISKVRRAPVVVSGREAVDKQVKLTLAGDASGIPHQPPITREKRRF